MIIGRSSTNLMSVFTVQIYLLILRCKNPWPLDHHRLKHTDKHYSSVLKIMDIHLDYYTMNQSYCYFELYKTTYLSST
jgi:hypothetical protein